MLRRFLASFDTSPSAMLCAFEPLRLSADARHTVLLALQSAVKVSISAASVSLPECACSGRGMQPETHPYPSSLD